MNGMLIFAALICLVTGGLAARKGYNFFCWVFAGGILGLLVLMFFPFVNKGKMDDAAAAKTKKIGNITGAVISALALGYVLLGILSR